DGRCPPGKGGDPGLRPAAVAGDRRGWRSAHTRAPRPAGPGSPAPGPPAYRRAPADTAKAPHAGARKLESGPAVCRRSRGTPCAPSPKAVAAGLRGAALAADSRPDKVRTSNPPP